MHGTCNYPDAKSNFEIVWKARYPRQSYYSPRHWLFVVIEIHIIYGPVMRQSSLTDRHKKLSSFLEFWDQAVLEILFAKQLPASNTLWRKIQRQPNVSPVRPLNTSKALPLCFFTHLSNPALPCCEDVPHSYTTWGMAILSWRKHGNTG